MNITKHEFLKKIPKVTVLGFVMVALLALVFLLNAGWIGTGAQQTNSNQNSDPIDICDSKQDGATCTLSGAERRQCRVGRCRNSVCKNEPAPVGAACRDTDGSPCTIAGCSAAGTCDQRSRLRPDNTTCSDGTPGCSGRQSCSGGQCLPPPGVGDPSQVVAISPKDVEVVASIPRVRQATAFNDCCVTCDHQTLQALVPTPQGPQLFEADGRLPLRRKFCGRITNYGVNDETADPRDITINILPAPVSPYPDFVAGLVKTVEPPLSGDDLRRFGPPTPFQQVKFDLQACLARAAVIKGKVIHAEVTPDEHFYGADGRFLPIESSAFRCGSIFGGTALNKKCLNCISSGDCQSELEPSGSLSGAEACVYGVYAYDHGEHSASGHTQLCRSFDSTHDHPEIHPFDAIWWRHPERKGWMFGVFQDDSNRYSFPHCGEQNNGNEWSQAPRDMTFRFPFRFPRRSTPQKACLRHVRTRKLKDNTPNIVRPLNVTTGAFGALGPEINALTIGGQRLLELVKESGTERETHVRVEGRIVGDDVVGQIILRVAVGCADRVGTKCVRPVPGAPTQALFDRLLQTNGLVTYDKDDPGAGYFYAELTYECACSLE